MKMNFLNHSLVNTFISFFMFIVFCMILLPLFVYKAIHTVLRYFYGEEKMKGKVVLITGASSGIGEHMAYEYAKKKASLVLVARRENRLCEVAERARELGSPDVLLVPADVSNLEDCKNFVDKAIQHFSRLDHLVNNAGICTIGPFEDVTDIKKLAPVMDINFWGSIYPTYFAIPHLKRTKGKIVINSSGAGVIHAPNSSFYNASKAAVISFYETLRTELAPSIKITTVTLGFIESEMTEGKLLLKDGTVEVYKQFKEEIIRALPVMNTEPCARAIVEGVCRGKRNVTEPQYVRVVFMLRFFFPELVEWYYRTFHFPTTKHA